jgi:hypothetical protein
MYTDFVFEKNLMPAYVCAFVSYKLVSDLLVWDHILEEVVLSRVRRAVNW